MYEFRCYELTFAQHNKLHRGYPQRIVSLAFEGALPFEPVAGKSLCLTFCMGDEFVMDARFTITNDTYYDGNEKKFCVHFEPVTHYIDNFGGELLALGVMLVDGLKKAGFTVTKEPDYFYLLTGTSIPRGGTNREELNFLVPSEEQAAELKK